MSSEINESVKKVNIPGFYSLKNQKKHTLCLANSVLEVEGAIRYHSLTNKFQGYNGNKWVEFSAEKGDKGNKGNDFIKQVKCVNLETDTKTETYLLKNQIGFLLPCETIDCSVESPVFNMKSIIGGQYILNNQNVNSCLIDNNPNQVVITPLARPFEWDISNSSINELKSDDNDQTFKCYGESILCKVHPDKEVSRGQIVRYSISNLLKQVCVEPLTYNGNINRFIQNISVCGIVLEDKKGGETVKICVKGITTVRLTSNVSDFFLVDLKQDKIGLPGLVGQDGFVFCSSTKPSVEYIKIGSFLENLENDNQKYILFKLD